MKCPKCKLINPESALQCDCGYVFQPEKLKQMSEEQEGKQSLTDADVSETDEFLKGNNFIFKMDPAAGWKVYDQWNNALLLIQHKLGWKAQVNVWRDEKKTRLSFSIKEIKEPLALFEVTNRYGLLIGTLKRKNPLSKTWFIRDNSEKNVAIFTLDTPLLPVLGRKGTFSSNNAEIGNFKIFKLSNKFDFHINWNECPDMDRRIAIGAAIIALNLEMKF